MAFSQQSNGAECDLRDDSDLNRHLRLAFSVLSPLLIWRLCCADVQCGDHEHSHRVCVAGNMIGDAGAASLAPALREMRQLQHLNLQCKQHTGGGSCGAECAGDWVLCAGLGLMTTAHSAWVV